MDYELQVGDRVKCIENYDPIRVGDTGEVLYASVNGGGVAIRWDRRDLRLHSCGDRCEDGHGWWINPSRLSLIDSADCSLPDMDVAPLL